ncbi:hypothetical protein Tco_0825444 [Tanacetum coccineum]
MSTLTFTDTHNMVAFLEKPAESDEFHEIINFLNANQIRLCRTSQFTQSTHLAHSTVSGNRKGKKQSDLHLEDAGGTDCLPTATIFEELARMREGKDFSGRITPLFETMMVRPTQDKGVDSGILGDSLQTPIPTQPSSSRSQKKQSRRKHKKDTVVTQEETQPDANVPTPSNDPPLSEKAKDAQAKEIADLKKRVQRLERKTKPRTIGLKRLKKVSMSRRVESSKDQESLGDHEDASKQGRTIEDIDKDADDSLVDDTQGRSDDADIFDINDLHGDEVNVDIPVGDNQEQSAKEREVDTSVEDSDAPTTIEEITLA